MRDAPELLEQQAQPHHLLQSPEQRGCILPGMTSIVWLGALSAPLFAGLALLRYQQPALTMPLAAVILLLTGMALSSIAFSGRRPVRRRLRAHEFTRSRAAAQRKGHFAGLLS